MVEEVILNLLGDEDGRVRHAAATALVAMVPKLFYPVDTPQHDPVIAKAEVCELLIICCFILIVFQLQTYKGCRLGGKLFCVFCKARWCNDV